MTEKRKILYTDLEQEYLNQLILNNEKKLITPNDLYKKSFPLMKKYEERKNRIRYNKITVKDRIRSFTPENFPYLTVFSKEYYPEKYWIKLQKLNK